MAFSSVHCPYILAEIEQAAESAPVNAKFTPE
jgi:hypothetical protein